MTLFHQLNQEEGRTVVFVTHDRDLAQEADRIVVIKDGQISIATK